MTWPVVKSTDLMDCRIFTVTERLTVAPHNGQTYPFYVLKARHWVVTVPLTVDRRVILVRQYRHGIQQDTLEVPAGVVEAGEAPAHAAARELLEETGYEARELLLLGQLHSNPAFMNNACHAYLAQDVVPVAPTHFDETESIEMEIVPLSDIPGLIVEGRITHAIAIAAFHLLALREISLAP